MKFALATVAALALTAPAFAGETKTPTAAPTVSSQSGLLLGGLGGAAAATVAVLAVVTVVAVAESNGTD